MPPQDDKVVPNYAAPTKMQWAQWAFYPLPPPSLDPYNHWDDEDDDDYDMPLKDVRTKWYDSNKDSYSSCCSKDKKYSCKRPPII